MIRGWNHRLLSIIIGITVTCSAIQGYNALKPDDLRRDGPIIIPNKSEIILQNGQNYTLICKSNTPITFKQQEIHEEKHGSDFNTSVRNEIDPNYKYSQALHLYNVDRFAVGYYGCFDDSIVTKDTLKNVTEELSNTEQASYIYVYVNGTDSLFAPMREVVIARSGSKVVIGCRPTTPDIKVNLTSSSKPAEYFTYSPKIGFLVKASSYDCIGLRGTKNTTKSIRCNYSGTVPSLPKIIGEKYFLEGETFTLNCTVKYQQIASMLKWKSPHNYSKEVIIETNEQKVTDILYSTITIVNATREDAGNYTCISRIGLDEQSSVIQKIFAQNGFIRFTKRNNEPFLDIRQQTLNLRHSIKDYPKADIVLYKDGKEVPKNPDKFKIVRRGSDVDFLMLDLNVYDTGIYALVASNEHVTTNVTYDLRVIASPTVDFGSEKPKTYLINTKAILQCLVVGYPIRKITWTFRNENGDEQEILDNVNTTAASIFQVFSQIRIPVLVSGNITCSAYDGNISIPKTQELLVYEVANGFGIKNKDKTWFSEKQKVQLTCFASKYTYKHISWFGNNYNLSEYVNYIQTPFSLVAVLVIDSISLDEAGNYTCLGIKMDGSTENENIIITVKETSKLVIMEPQKDEDVGVKEFHPIQLTCAANAVPPPVVSWYKNGELLNDSDVTIATEYTDHTFVNSSVIIQKMLEEYKGKYECRVNSGDENKTRAFNLLIEEKTTYMSIYFRICGALACVLGIIVAYLVWKIRKEKQFRKELAKAGLLYFNEGVTKSINPELGIDEQAELLPYNDKFEFPPEKLKWGQQLGAGAFGVVYKAEARGIINAEETTPVAVKTVKKDADNMYIKALATELKIMVHLGKHVNIVNLLGACTKKVAKRELIVIVEYCKFGNIHNYMQRHREVFIDQLTDNKEKNFGRVNKGFSCSSGSSGMHSDYFGSNHTQETDHTFVNTANTNRSARKVSETGYIQPEWRSNYESDYSFDGRNPRPLTSRDLLAWAFQIARGMEYLANRKVLHGDLAARNVLLAEDNIVKICDFGLARSIYKNDEYQKQENSPLPIKWLAVECMTDRIFSTQSDVWAFGIVLWELFSLAKTPYPNISPQNLLQYLEAGHRLEKPPYADDKVYDVMRRCWEQKPLARPSFSQLQEILGSFLEDNVRNHYVDLNSAFMNSNVNVDGEDYLAMVSAPDYKNMVTPSPHHYVNESQKFFPNTPTPTPQLQPDDEGYLPMSPVKKLSPRVQGTKFDFDSRKLNPRISDENVHGSEWTPMLTLNNLPARSDSESDHDGNYSPYSKMCPGIPEETDEVFEINNQNLKNTQNTAVSNPTYVTMDVDIEKKPNNISNNYINVMANGLVK
ncbi:vascular endothelial growth factor receptor 1 isoform X2 [Epargyreus clarus]|uniref:vascular endothelial growth factor receptor 1 isoform X2 n=1 Tax=Epargyreus clarus TaxID=520877 RepID=UPI003C2AF117